LLLEYSRPALEDSAGVGVVVTPQQVAAAVSEAIEEKKDQLIEERSVHSLSSRFTKLTGTFMLFALLPGQLDLYQLQCNKRPAAIAGGCQASWLCCCCCCCIPIAMFFSECVQQQLLL